MDFSCLTYWSKNLHLDFFKKTSQSLLYKFFTMYKKMIKHSQSFIVFFKYFILELFYYVSHILYRVRSQAY